MATTSPPERRPLFLAPTPPATDHAVRVDEAEADRLYAESMAAARRAARVAADLERLASTAPQPGWQLAATSARRAEAGLRAAAEAIPELPLDVPPADRHRAIVLGPLSIDRLRRLAFWAGSALALTRLEFDLLVALAERPGGVVPKEDLMRRVWGYSGRVTRTRTVDSHASRLRRALLDAGSGATTIVNVWGVGYRLMVAESEGAA
ncbi:winged helix-turn-helix domain-containing protein [Miltoncostaea oceani]|uniref:winged helix-turn-helix domain-containing protein n=1 Tax=Miltoncostaea oceani TaxID=2843216 RepID=UPI001C3DFEDC|nr:response regulator transcription factor [Miltoncostaea oceani]